jgi:MFS family permease
VNLTEGDVRGAPKLRAIFSPGFAWLFGGLFAYILNANLFALMPYYLAQRGASEPLYGTAAGMMGLGGVAAMAALGSLADRVSRRRLVLRYMQVACAGNLLSLAALQWAPAWYVLVAACHGVMVGAGLPVVFVWASELSPPHRRTETFALLGIAGLTGDSLGPLLGEALLQTQPYPDAPAAYGTVFAAANVLWPISLLCFVRAPDVPPAAHAPADGGLRSLLRLRALRSSLFGAVAFGGALGVMLNLGKNFVTSIGLEFVSVLLGGHTLGAVLVRIGLPWLLTRVDRVRLVPIALLGVAASMSLLAIARGYGMLLFAGLVYGISHGLLFPTLLARWIDYGGSHAAGRISTLFMGTFSLGAGLWPLLGGMVLGTLGFPALFAMVAVTCTGAILMQRSSERHFTAAMGVASASLRKPED